ncbi:MAG: hypothetical protein IPG50_28055 [Myxococcales bacterium]|nr:hypothetical protein [Myxococcales bacterium]
MGPPYRPDAPRPDPELARLAAQGERRRVQAAVEADRGRNRAGDRNLRVAIGGFRGSTLKRVLLGVVIAAAVTGVAAVVMTEKGPSRGGVVAMAFGATMCTFMLWVFVPPFASRATVSAEERWVGSQPFRLVGYLEVLALTPLFQRSLTFRLQWQPGGRPPDYSLIHGAIGAIDPGARVRSCDETGATIVSGPVSGHTGISSNRVPVYRNHRLPAHVHAVVEKFLVPLHRSHPITEVSVEG